MFDVISVMLLISVVGLFLQRRRFESPRLAPYLVIALVAIVGHWLGTNGGGVAAVGLLTAGAFLALHLASEPYRDSKKERPDAA